MTEAKIEIVAKPIELFKIFGKGVPQHLFILITKSDGKQTAIRGGPKGGNNFWNWIKDDLKVTTEVYDDNHPDWKKKEDIHHTHLLAHGSNAQIDSYINNMDFKKTYEFINSAKFDYKVAGITFGSWQNSNAVAKIVTEAMGLKFELPTYQNSKGEYVKVIAPGFNDNLEYSFVDTFISPSLINFLHSDNFKREISSDFKSISYTDKETGIKVYVQNTGAVKIGNTYVVEGMSVEEVAKILGVPEKNVIENYDSTGIDFRKTFTIIPDSQVSRDNAGNILLPNASKYFFGTINSKAQDLLEKSGIKNLVYRDPIILDIKSKGFQFISITESSAFYNFNHDLYDQKCGWIGKDLAFLVYDLNDDGKINTPDEIFGNKNSPGVKQLENYDINKDKLLNEQDSVFSQLKVWRDINLNGQVDYGELTSLQDENIKTFHLNAKGSDINSGGNQIKATGLFETNDNILRPYVEANFQCDNFNTRYSLKADIRSLSADDLLIPHTRGYGNLPLILESALLDEKFKKSLLKLYTIKPSEYYSLEDNIKNILFLWAGTNDNANYKLKGKDIDNNIVFFLGKFKGELYNQNEQLDSDKLISTWNEVLVYFKSRLIAQTTFIQIFDKIIYEYNSDSLELNESWDEIFHRIVSFEPKNLVDSLYYYHTIKTVILGLTNQTNQAPDIQKLEQISITQILTSNGIDKTLLSNNYDLSKVILSPFSAELEGSNSNDLIFCLNKNNSRIYNYKGNDIFFWGRSMGSYELMQSEYYSNTGSDMIWMLGNLTQYDIDIFSSGGKNLVIKIKETNEILTIVNHMTVYAAIEAIKFNGEENMNLLENIEIRGSNKDETLQGSDRNDIFNSLKGNDIQYGLKGNDVYLWGSGMGNDTIVEVNDKYKDGDPNDRIKLIDDLKREDLKIYSNGDQNLYIEIIKSGEILTIQGHYQQRSMKVEFLEFSNGELLDLNKNILLRAIEENAIVHGSDNNDIYFGSKGNQTFRDYGGDDIYLWGNGMGNDTIFEACSSYNNYDKHDKILLIGNIAKNDIDLYYNGSNLCIQIKKTFELLTVNKQNSEVCCQVEYLQFSDGSIIDLIGSNHQKTLSDIMLDL
jgi:hypothetical protein